MYDGPVAYETALNQNFIYFIIFGIVLLLLLVVSLIALAKIFKKANRSGISAFIPIYNIITLLEITNMSKLYLILLLVPGINIIFNLLVMFSLATSFKKSKLFAVGLAFLPFIFYPILAFGDSEYIGINLTAMEGKNTVVEIPKVVEPEENKPVVHEEEDTSLKNINISIGGGVYQKDYTNTLLEVDKNQTILMKNNPAVNQITNNITSDTPSFIKPLAVEENVPVKEQSSMISFDFPTPISTVEIKEEINHQNSDNSISNNLDMNRNNSIVSDPVSINKEPTITKMQPVPNPEITPSTNNEPVQNADYISCPKCGAKIKHNAKVCFLCGNKIE